MGTVHVTTIAAFQWLTLVLGLVWILRALWVPPKAMHAAAGARFRLFGHPVTATGFGLPVLLFFLLALLQMVPLPPSVIGLVSPATAKLHAESLPAGGADGGPDFSETGSFLLGAGHDGVVEKILQERETLPLELGTEISSYRPLSLYPYATADRLLLFLSLCTLFGVALHVFSTRARIERLLRAVVLFGFALALFGIVQRLSWNGKLFWRIPVDEAASPFGPFINHNHFAALLAMIVPIATGMLMDEARRLFPRRASAGKTILSVHGPEPFARMLLAAFTVGIMAGAVVLSASRGAVLALVAALVLYGGALVAQGRFGRPETAVAAVLILVALGLSFWLGVGPLAEKLQAIGNVESEPSLFSRVLGYRATIEMIRDFPLLGTGLGTFPQAWKHYYPSGTAAVWHEAHNDYLQLFAEAGGAGFVIFVAAFAIFAWRYLLPGILNGKEAESYAMHGVVVGIVAVALHSLVDFPLQIIGCAVLFVVLSAVAVAYRTQVETAA
jgi:O-antigen ligase